VSSSSTAALNVAVSALLQIAVIFFITDGMQVTPQGDHKVTKNKSKFGSRRATDEARIEMKLEVNEASNNTRSKGRRRGEEAKKKLELLKREIVSAILAIE
jgi:hypothetical protein